MEKGSHSSKNSINNRYTWVYWFLIIIPLFTMLLEIDSFANRFLTCLFVICLGFINALCSGGFFNLVTHFPLEMIVSLSAGQGFSGIAMNVIQFIVLASIKGDDKKAIVSRAWVFFSVSALILVVCFILLLISFRNEYFRYYLDKSAVKKVILKIFLFLILLQEICSMKI